MTTFKRNPYTRRVIATKKYALHERLRLDDLSGNYNWNSVKGWIQEDPLLLYLHIYEPAKHGLERVSLFKDAIKEFHLELQRTHPALLRKIIRKKAQRRNNNRQITH